MPDGRHATAVDDAVAAADEIGFPCVIKAQVRTGKRGKAGGIKVAADQDEARRHADAILGMDIRGFTVDDLGVERASEIAAEYYASIILDRSEKELLAMLSHMGGMDVEEWPSATRPRWSGATSSPTPRRTPGPPARSPPRPESTRT